MFYVVGTIAIVPEKRDALTAHSKAGHFKVRRKAGVEGAASRRIEIVSDGKVEIM